ncbi:MAG TPA: type II toxin-antitoxin system YafQ family toxin [Lacipirellulaceae bacterium]
MRRELVRTTGFIRAARRHLKKNPRLAADVVRALEMLAENASDKRLKTHKLKGALDGIWACSAGRDLRILFEFTKQEGKEALLLLSIGTHDEVY